MSNCHSKAQLMFARLARLGLGIDGGPADGLAAGTAHGGGWQGPSRAGKRQGRAWQGDKMPERHRSDIKPCYC